MTELSVILGLNLASVLLVLGLARWLLQDAPLANEARTLVAAMRGAIATFRAGQTRRTLIAFSIVGAAAVSSTFALAPRAGTVTQLCLGLLLGGTFGFGLGRLSSAFGARACRTTAAAVGGSSTAPLLASLRGAAALTLGLELAVSLLTVSALLWTHVSNASDLAQWLPDARTLLAAAALGSVATSAIVHSTGSAVSGAAEAGLHELDPRTPARFRLQPQNPALVTSAVGPELGRMSIHAHDYIALSLLCNVTALSGVPSDPGGVPFPLLAVCLLIRASGLAASGIALLSVRVDDADDPVVALFRGQLAAGVMSALCIVGSCRWLLDDASWASAAGIGALGLLGQVVTAFVARSWLQRRAAALRSIRDAANSGPSAAATGAGLGGLFATAVLLVPVAVFALALALALGRGLESGVVGAFALCLAGFVTTLPFSLSLGAAEPVIESGCGLASLGPNGSGPQGLARLSALDFVAAAFRSMGETHATSVWVVVVAGLSLLSLQHLAPEPNSAIAATSCLVGVGFVLTTVSLSLLHAARTTTSCSAEVQRQLRAGTREGPGKLAVPTDFSPSYKDALHSSLDVALAGVTLPAAALLSLPLGLCAVASHWLDGSELHAAVGWFLAAALCLALSLGAVSAGGAALISAARRHSRASSGAVQLALNDAELFAQATGLQLALASRLALAGATATGFVLVAVVG